MPKSNPGNGFAAPDLRTVANDADGRGGITLPIVRANPLKSDRATVADGADAKPPAPIRARRNRLEGTAMTAAEALQAGRVAGIELRLDGDDLTLKASGPPPAAILDLLSRNKAGIVALLRLGRDGWSAENWQVFFDERWD